MSRRAVFCVLVAACLLLPGEAAGFFLSGRVVTEAGAPVEGASVEVTESRSGYAQGLRWLDGEAEPEVLTSTVTDETGWYRLEVPRTGMWRVAVDAPRFVPMERRPEAYVDDERLATVTLVPDEGLPATVTAAGEPLAGARVWAGSTLSSDGPWATFDLREWRPSWPGRFTDAQGRVTLPRARQERLRVVAWKEGFVEVSREGVTGAVTLKLEPAARRRVVRVVDARGKPVKEALVRVGENPSWSAGTTGEEGLWKLEVPTSGELTLQADAGDGRWITRTFEDPLDEILELRLAEPTVLDGRVSDAETGASVDGALVFRDRSGRFAESGDDGRYRLVFSEPGEQETVQAVAPRHRMTTVRLTMPPRGNVSFALQPAYMLRGSVVDRAGQPVSGAVVALVENPFFLQRGFDVPGARTSVTDPEGRFLLVQVRDSPNLQLVARAEGYAPTVQPVSATADEDLVLTLGPGAILKGRAVDGDGEPVPGAWARVFPEVQMGDRRVSLRKLSGAALETEFEATADDEGRFRIPRVPSGFFSLQMDAQRFASRLLTGIEVPAGEEAVDLGEISLEPGAILRGFVTDDRGRPVSGARVSVVDGGSGRMAAMTMRGRSGAAMSEQLTEDDGRFRFDDLEAGAVYTVVAAKEGWVSEQKTTEIPLDEPLELVLGTGGRLFGRVTTPAGEPLSRAVIGAQPEPEEGTPAAMARAFGFGQNERLNEDGTFSFDALPSGPVRLHVSDDRGQISKHGPFEVVAGGQVGPLRLVHEAGAVVEGRVLRADGEPAGGVPVFVEMVDGAGRGDRTDASGRFRLQGLDPGPITVAARDPELGRAARELEVHRGVQHVELVLEPSLRVTGRVLDSGGRPVTRGHVSLVPIRADPSPTVMTAMLHSGVQLTSDGTFTLPVDEPGDYALRVEAAGFVPWSTPDSEPLRVGETPVEGLVIRLERGGKIVGRISGLAEDDLSRVRVAARRSDPPAHRPGTVDYRGRYEIPSVDEGAWTVTATTGQPPRRISREVTVVAQDEEARLDLTFPENELTLRGLVLLDGEPVQGARVLVRSSEDPQGQLVTGQTDSFGRFRTAGLLPGRYVVQAFQNPFDRNVVLRGQSEIDLVADQELVVELERTQPETQ